MLLQQKHKWLQWLQGEVYNTYIICYLQREIFCHVQDIMHRMIATMEFPALNACCRQLQGAGKGTITTESRNMGFWKSLAAGFYFLQVLTDGCLFQAQEITFKLYFLIF